MDKFGFDEVTSSARTGWQSDDGSLLTGDAMADGIDSATARMSMEQSGMRMGTARRMRKRKSDEEYVRLDAACDLIMGQSPASSSYNTQKDGLPFFQGNADFGEYYPVARIWCSAATTIVEKNTILISVRAPIGAVNFSDRQCCIGRGLAGIIPKDEYELKYIYYVLKNKHKELNLKGTGSTFKAISKNALGETLIRKLTKTEQKEYVERLDCVSAIIANRKKQLEELDTLIKARFVEMFGDPIKNDKGFEVRKGGDCFKLSNGKFVPESKRFSSGIPAYGGNGISWYTDDVIFEGDTIVVGRVGFQSGNVHLAKGPLWITDNAMYISRFNGKSYNLVFLTALMEHIDFTRYQDAGDLKKITQKPFMEMDFIYPPIELQKQFAAFVEQADKLKVEIQKSLDELQLLFDSLMQEYFG